MMKNRKYFTLIPACALFVFSACTDLEIEETDSIIVNQTGEFTGVGDVDATLSGIYDAVRGQLENQANLYALNEVSTDEFLVPTRGTDWGDNGVWRTLHQHSWSPIHQHVRDTWNEQNSIIFRTTEIIDERSNATPQQEAEARFLRAFATFWVMDLYGQVPFRGPDEGIEIDPTVMSRAEAFDFIMEDLNTAAANIATASPIGDTLPLLLSLDAKVVLQGLNKKTILPLKNFFVNYRKTKLKKRQFIHSIIIPVLKKNIFKAYKISKRIDDDISSVCASFSLEIKNKKIKNIKIAYGGMASTPKRAINCEKILINKNISEENIEKAKKILEKDFKPINDMRASKNYRMEIAKNLLMKCFIEIKDNKLVRLN